MDCEIVSEERTPFECKVVIRIEAESVQEVWDEEVSRLADEMMVPGFRIGRAPAFLVVNRVGREEIWRTVREIAARRALSVLLRDADPPPLTPPSVDFGEEPEQEDDEAENGDWEPGQALEFTATYLLPPPTPEEIERDLMRGIGGEVVSPDIEETWWDTEPPTMPPDPRASIPGSGIERNPATGPLGRLARPRSERSWPLPEPEQDDEEQD